jgi:hypothetical protein
MEDENFRGWVESIERGFDPDRLGLPQEGYVHR